MPDEPGWGDALSVWNDVDEPPPVTEAIQVWLVELSACLGAIDNCLRLLSDEERQRAARTRAGQTREQFVVGRAVLRLLVGKALAARADAVVFARNAQGKLSVSASDNLWFNVAHSRGMIVVALTRSGPVGVDIEAMDRGVDVVEVAKTAFSADEVDRLERIASLSERRVAFFRCWTRKEAVVKADGCGLTIPLTDFTVPMDGARGGEVRLGAHGGCAGETYRVGEIAVGESYMGALAALRRRQRVVGYGLAEDALFRLIHGSLRGSV